MRPPGISRPGRLLSRIGWRGSVVLLLLLLPLSAEAQYVVGPSVIAGGGSRMTGGSYVVTGTTGQSSPVGTSAAGAYQTHHGFWHAATGGGGSLSPMVLAITLLNPTAARLSWATVTGATFYDLYRSTTAFFNASGAPWRTVAAPATSSDFAAGIGDVATNYFFRGIARNATQLSPQSNVAGEFDYGCDIPGAARGGSGAQDGNKN
ncbi:hypothetical protein JXA88_18190 [Candidatus Fermentibacteria bacterium]|nr:hypothetical protein [Candidatus Fermentibacteria bacterium]